MANVDVRPRGPGSIFDAIPPRPPIGGQHEGHYNEATVNGMLQYFNSEVFDLPLNLEVLRDFNLSAKDRRYYFERFLPLVVKRLVKDITSNEPASNDPEEIFRELSVEHRAIALRIIEIIVDNRRRINQVRAQIIIAVLERVRLAIQDNGLLFRSVFNPSLSTIDKFLDVYIKTLT